MPAAVQIKVIKPQRFKDSAFKAAMEQAAKEAANEMEKDFEKTVETWDDKPDFEKIVSVAPNVEILVGTDDKVYGYVNDGTKKGYPIPKSPRSYPLRFQWGGKGSYKAKTKPKVIGSTPGGPSGPMVSRMSVWHPGIKARKFDETIEKKWRSPFKTRMEKAMSRAAKASGHAIA